MTSFVESTITFPYKRSLGPVVGAFMTALTEKRILGIRNGDAVLVPPMEWDPATGAELGPRPVEVGPAGTVDVVDLGAGARRAAPARPALRLRLRASRRRDDAAAARGRRRLARRHGGRPAGRPPLAGHPSGPPHRHRLLRAGRGARGGRARTGVRRTSRSPAWTTSPRSPTGTRCRRRHPGGRRLEGEPPARCHAARCASGSTPAARLAARSTRWSSAPSTRSTCPQTGTITNFTIITPVQYPGRPRPSRSCGPSCCSTASTSCSRTSRRSSCRRPTCRSASGSPRSGRRRPRPIDDTGNMGGAFGSLLGWMPNGEPDIDDPDLVNRIF